MSLRSNYQFSITNFQMIKRNEPPEGVGTAGGSLRARGKLKPNLHPSTPPSTKLSKILQKAKDLVPPAEQARRNASVSSQVYHIGSANPPNISKETLAGKVKGNKLFKISLITFRIYKHKQLFCEPQATKLPIETKSDEGKLISGGYQLTNKILNAHNKC